MFWRFIMVEIGSSVGPMAAAYVEMSSVRYEFRVDSSSIAASTDELLDGGATVDLEL